ncbi:MAG: cupredoxin family copper-binding protein [Thermomicrobiales bacterium]
MQALVGARTAADLNLAAQILLLVGLWVGFTLARRKQFDRHANVQTAMVLLNLVLIVTVMATSFYAYVIASGSTTGRVAQLMIVHGILGIIVQLFALYLVIRMRTSWIPKAYRISNIKTAMRATLAAWTVLVVIGVGIYVERYLDQRATVTAPLAEMRQLGADLYVHAVELDDASRRDSVAAVRRHSEHLINLIEGSNSMYYGDDDANGHIEDPGDGIGLRARLGAVAATLPNPEAAALAATLDGQLDRIVQLSLGLLGDSTPGERAVPVAEILELARKTNGEGVFDLDQDARDAGVAQQPTLLMSNSGGDGGTVTIHEDHFAFLPSSVTIPAGTTVIWVNDETAKHTVTADDLSFDSGDQSLGVSYSHTFADPGVYPYFCRYHGDVGGLGMAGTIVVQ